MRLTRTRVLFGGAFVLGAAVIAGLAFLLVSITEHKTESRLVALHVAEIGPNELDPAVWGQNFPKEYERFQMMQDSTHRTEFGGNVPYSKLERWPILTKLWAGYPFSVEYNEERSHLYSLTDQKATKRVTQFNQPGACGNCHAAEAPQLIEQMGWENFNHTPYNDVKDQFHTSTSCADCHDPETMNLRITRPAFKNAMAARGIDLSKASLQDMRSYVCAQCHVEYYFAGDNKVLTFPWTNGLNVDDIANYYDQIGFKDWTQGLTGAPMITIQHPEFETWSGSIHAQSGVSCADCHMPYIRDGAVKISDHWLRSPLLNVNTACQTCHKQSEDDLKARVKSIQETTYGLVVASENAISDAIDAIVAAKNAGATDDQLQQARQLHREASLRWDFVSSENGMGFHNPQEAARVLAESIDYARQAQLAAERIGQNKTE